MYDWKVTVVFGLPALLLRYQLYSSFICVYANTGKIVAGSVSCYLLNFFSNALNAEG